MSFKVRIANTGSAVDCAADRTILNAAVSAGVDYPYGCASGNCGLCISELVSGEVSLRPYADNALQESQQARGLTLACRAEPRSDVAIRWLGKSQMAT